MSPPPQHVVLFRYALVAAVLVAVVVTLVVLPWGDVVAALDPWVDGLRRTRYS